MLRSRQGRLVPACVWQALPVAQLQARAEAVGCDIALKLCVLLQGHLSPELANTQTLKLPAGSSAPLPAGADVSLPQEPQEPARQLPEHLASEATSNGLEHKAQNGSAGDPLSSGLLVHAGSQNLMRFEG